jgi:hypothetical protein
MKMFEGKRLRWLALAYEKITKIGCFVQAVQRFSADCKILERSPAFFLSMRHKARLSSPNKVSNCKSLRRSRGACRQRYRSPASSWHLGEPETKNQNEYLLVSTQTGE